MKYPRRIAALRGNRGRRIVTVYQTGPSTWKIYLKVDREHFATQEASSRRDALATAKAWT